jgi:uncharacterized protein with ACT and thioredoxin-like domain
MSEFEKYTLKGSQVVEKIKQLIKEGNVRNVRLLHDDRVIMEMPLMLGAPAAAALVIAAPLIAAVGAFAALVTNCTLEVERIKPEDKQ